MAKIVFIVPRPEMVEHVNKVVQKNQLSNVSVVVANTSQVTAVAQQELSSGADIFVARGLQATVLRATFDTPLVEMRLTGQEMGMLVVKAKRMLALPHPKIAVIGNINMFCDMRSFSELYDMDLREYFINGKDLGDATYLRGATDQAISDGVDIVIGGEVVCNQAARHSFPAIFLDAQEESIAEALRMAQSVAYTADLERKNSAEIRTLIDYSFNGIIMIDREGSIVRTNDVAEKLLRLEEQKNPSISISALIPDLDQELLSKVMQGEEIYSTLLRVQNALVVANIAPVRDRLEVQSAIISFYERGRVEEMEEEIRRGLYRQGNTAQHTFDNLVGESQEFKRIVDQAKTFAKFNVPVLITGEPGTEKEILAQCIYNASVLSNGEFLSASCDSLPPHELDTVLFGEQRKSSEVQKGLLDMAEGGVLFIDEIQCMDLYTQYKLYKLLHKNTILRSGNSRPLPANVRIIAASSQNLVPLVKKGLFREDLFYALNVLSLDIPPLRHRKQDLLRWIDHYIEEMGQLYSRYIRITSSAYRLLTDYEWDGNLPQIRSFCKRVVILAPKRMVDERFIAEQLKHAFPIVRRSSDDKIIIYKDPKAAKLAEILEECGGNRTVAAEKMGISKSTLWRRMKQYGIMEE